MTRRQHNFKGWAEGADVLANSGTGSGDQFTRVVRASGADINATSAAAMAGATMGARLTAPASTPVALGWSPLATFTNLAVAVDYKTDSIPTIESRLLNTFRGDASSASPRINGLNTGALRFVDAAGGVVATSAVQTLAQWQSGFYIQLYIVSGTTTANGVLQAKITRLSDSTVIMDTGALAGNAQTLGFQGFDVGRASGSTWTGTVDLGNIAFEDAATGLIPRASSNMPPTAGISSSKISGVQAGETFTLTLSELDDVAVTTRTFRQVSGPSAISITGTGLSRTVVAPPTLADSTLVFGYKTGDAEGLESAEATVSVDVVAATRRVCTVGGATPTMVPSFRRLIT